MVLCIIFIKVLVFKIYPFLIKNLISEQGVIRFYIEVYIVDKDMAFITCLGLNKKSVYLMLLYICI